MRVKQDINFIDKPLWFLSTTSKYSGKIWNDIDGYVYRTNYKLPDKLDILILFYMLLQSQKMGYKQEMSFTRYEIIKSCELPLNANSYNRLRDSLERWLNVSVKFNGTFYDGKEYLEIGFHIIDSYEIDKKTKELKLTFNPKWLLKIKESKFCKYVNFEHYKALKRPISRRLFEMLSKSFKGREVWESDLVKLGIKLTISKRKVMRKGQEVEVLYHSDVLKVIKPAINEINKLSENKEALKSMEIKENEIFCIDYELRKKNKIIVFKKKKPEWVLKKNIEVQGYKGEEKTELTSLIELSKSKAKGVSAAIEKCFEEHGENYVRWNILYANQEAKKNYAAFLKKALKENWGEEYREKQEHKEATESKAKEEKKKDKKESEGRLKKDQEIFELNQQFKSLPKEEQDSLWNEAVEFYKPNWHSETPMPRDMVMSKIREILQERKKQAKEKK